MPRKSIDEEKRTERISLIVTPSLFEDIEVLADSQGISVNELVTGVMSDVVKKNAKLITMFKQAREMAKKSFVNPAAVTVKRKSKKSAESAADTTETE